MSNLVTYETRAGVAHITMNDGKVNVMSTAMLADLNAAFDRAEKEADCAILRSSRPGIFSAGFDVKVFAANNPEHSLEMTKSGAELALRLLSFPMPLIGLLEGHAYPMGTFLLLACDIRIATEGPHRMGLNEVAIGITPPSFAIELARSRVHPAWLSRTVTLGEMYQQEDALTAGFIDRIVPVGRLEDTLAQLTKDLQGVHRPSHISAKERLRQPTMDAMRKAIDTELTLAAYRARSQTPSTIKLPT